MLACVLRRARHTSPLACQHGLFDKVGALDDATFGLLIIYGATRQVRILARLRDLADLEARRFAFMSSVRPSFLLVQRFFYPQLGTGRRSNSGMMTGRDMADCAECSLVSMHYPQIRGFRCGGLGMTPRFRLCPRHWLTSEWLSCLVYKSSLPTGARRRQPMTRGCVAALVSLPGLHTNFFGNRRTRRICSSFSSADGCGSIVSL